MSKVIVSELKAGDKLAWLSPTGVEREITFVSRKINKTYACNTFNCQDFAGQYGPEDEGSITLADPDIYARCSIKTEAAK